MLKRGPALSSSICQLVHLVLPLPPPQKKKSTGINLELHSSYQIWKKRLLCFSQVSPYVTVLDSGLMPWIQDSRYWILDSNNCYWNSRFLELHSRSQSPGAKFSWTPKSRLPYSTGLYLRLPSIQTAIPECPWVSKAVPKNRTYSVSDACKRYIDPIQPPALINSHSLTSSGNTWPGYFLSISNAMLENVADILLSV